jgi:hypothetical protein
VIGVFADTSFVETRIKTSLDRVRMTCTSALAILLLLASALDSQAKKQNCELCQRVIADGDNIMIMKDKVRNVKKSICETCSKLEHTCTLCNMPIYDKNYTDLGDGRIFCSLDSKDLIMDDAQAGPIFDGVKIDLQRIFAQWAPVPDKGISIHVVSQKEFINAHRDSPYSPDADGLLGITISRKPSATQWVHQIYILKGLGTAQFTAVAAHEGAHVWLNEHGTRIPALHADAREGFCEFIARQVMLDRAVGDEVKRIEKNNYSRGQIDAFIQADTRFTFHRTIDWVLNGADTYLNTDKLDRLLVLREGVKPLQPHQPKEAISSIPSTVTQPSVPTSTSPPVPDQLVLKGISRAGRSSLALINNRTLGVGEQAKVRIGEGSVVIKCLSINAQSVVVQWEGTNRKQELVLSGP